LELAVLTRMPKARWVQLASLKAESQPLRQQQRHLLEVLDTLQRNQPRQRRLRLQRLRPQRNPQQLQIQQCLDLAAPPNALLVKRAYMPLRK